MKDKLAQNARGMYEELFGCQQEVGRWGKRRCF